jgi:hypothetical protein
MKKRLLTSLVVLIGLFLLSSSIVWAVNLPMAICLDSIQSDDCNSGRVLNKQNDTARWTDFREESYRSCPNGRVNVNDIVDLISCDGSIDYGSIDVSSSLPTSTGVAKPVLEEVRDCFFAYDQPRIINVTLPVIDCSNNKSCGAIVGVINADIVWVSTSGTGTTDVPVEVLTADGLETEWYGGDIVDDAERWQSFVNHFNLKDVEGKEPIMIEKKSIYFKPECSF